MIRSVQQLQSLNDKNLRPFIFEVKCRNIDWSYTSRKQQTRCINLFLEWIPFTFERNRCDWKIKYDLVKSHNRLVHCYDINIIMMSWWHSVWTNSHQWLKHKSAKVCSPKYYEFPLSITKLTLNEPAMKIWLNQTR